MNQKHRPVIKSKKSEVSGARSANRFESTFELIIEEIAVVSNGVKRALATKAFEARGRRNSVDVHVYR